MELQPGSYFKIDGEGFEYAGQHTNPNSSEVQVVGRIHPDIPVAEGALHKLFPLPVLEKQGVKIGPFGEAFPYSSYVREKLTWQERLGTEIEVPHPPKLLVDTLKIAKEAGIDSFEAHFLPRGKLSRQGITIGGKLVPFPEGWKAPEEWFFDEIEGKNDEKKKNIAESALTLPGAWIIVDRTQKPNYESGNQVYQDDPFRPLIERLAAENKISPTVAGSRFSISFNERAQHFDHFLAKTLGLEGKGVKITVPTEAIYNLIGNLFHPEWGETSTYEWLDDKYTGSVGDDRLIGGGSGGGGLSGVYYGSWAGFRGDSVGFRPLVVFSPSA